MSDLKKGFLSKITDRNPTKIKVDKLAKEFLNKYVNEKLFSQNLTDAQKKDKERLDKEIEKLNKELEAYIKRPVYHNAFEWRFEFPEVLDNEGNFKGFDLVIANPPYIRQEELSELKKYLQERYKVYVPGVDLFSYFYELGYSILKKNGIFSFINNTFDKTTAGKVLREFVFKNFKLKKYIDFTSVIVFEEATTYPVILVAEKSQEKLSFQYFKFNKENFKNKDLMYDEDNLASLQQGSLKPAAWNFLNLKEAAILHKIESHRPLIETYGKSYRGIITGINEAFVTQKALGKTINLKPVYDGKDLKKWVAPNPAKQMIVFESKSTKKKFGALEEKDALIKMKEEYPEI